MKGKKVLFIKPDRIMSCVEIEELRRALVKVSKYTKDGFEFIILPEVEALDKKSTEEYFKEVLEWLQKKDLIDRLEV